MKTRTSEGYIRDLDENILIGIVMTLTGGSANPEVVVAHIRRVRSQRFEEYKTSIHILGEK